MINPFDLKIDSKRPISVGIDPACQYADGKAISKLLQLAESREVELMSPPLAETDWLRKLRDAGVDVATHIDPKIGLPVVETVTPRSQRTRLVDTVDLWVSSNLKPQPGTPSAWRRIKPEDSLELIRLLLVGNDQYVAGRDMYIDETLYYIARSQKVFGSLYNRTASSTSSFRSMQRQLILAQLTSARRRAEFLCRAADAACFNALRTPSNEAHTRVVYHLAYFVCLATGLLDDLAWITAYLHDLTLDRRNVGLHDKSFRKALEVYNPGLANSLKSAKLASRIAFLWPLRDEVQHRLFLRSAVLTDVNAGKNESVVWIPKETIDQIKRIGGSKQIHRWGITYPHDEQLVEARLFVGESLASIATVCDCVIGHWGLLNPGTDGPYGEPAASQRSSSNLTPILD